MHVQDLATVGCRVGGDCSHPLLSIGCGCRQDIVTAHEHFNMDKFVQQFQEALKVTAPRKRAFLLSWMQVRSGYNIILSQALTLRLSCHKH